VKLSRLCHAALYRLVSEAADMARKPQELRPVMTRIPEALRRRLERSAAASGRSMNTEIIHRLEQSFRRDELFLGQAATMKKFASELAIELTQRVASLAAANKKGGVGLAEAQSTSLVGLLADIGKPKEDGES
jgi:Arc-like DNA binding domain